MNNKSKNPAQMIKTQKGNFFIKMNNLLFYLTATGQRFFSPRELDTAKLPNTQGWEDAKIKWKGAVVEDVPAEMMESATRVYLGIYGEDGTKRNISFEANQEQSDQIQIAQGEQLTKITTFAKDSIKKAGAVKTGKHNTGFNNQATGGNTIGNAPGAEKLKAMLPKK